MAQQTLHEEYAEQTAREKRQQAARRRRNERRRRRKRYPAKKRGQPWMQIEYYLCLFSVVVVLSMGFHFVSEAWYSMNVSRRNAEIVKSNEPEYITFIRGVIRSADEEPEEQPPEPEPQPEPQPAYTVDIEQFKDDAGYAGMVYAMRNEYPEQVSTILSHYENAVVFYEGESTTIAQIEDYPISQRMLQLICDNPETIDFVADYPSKYELYHGETFSLADDLNNADGVPHLLQWDERWGYESYGDGMIGYTGCGPTCLAMVALYLTRDTSVTPKVIGDYADRTGYYVNGVGSTWSLIDTGCESFGIKGTEMSVSKDDMIAQLEQGHPLICAVGEGDFTRSGHFIVISGYRNGAFLVNDPNSIIRTEKTWDYWTLEDQIKNVWYYTLLEQE